MKTAAALLIALLGWAPLASAQLTKPQRGDLPHPLTIVPAALELPATRVGELSPAVPVTVTNNGRIQAVLTLAALLGPNAGDFSVSSPSGLPSVLAPGASTLLELRFQPTAVGPRQAVLQLGQTPHPPSGAQAQVSGVAFGPLGAEVLINAGGNDYLDSLSQTWLADYGYDTEGSVIASPGTPIQNTSDPELYRRAREGKNLGWSWDLPNGGYQVTLHFAELQKNAGGARVFDVTVEDTLVRANYDVFAVKGKFNADKITTLVEVYDGKLDIALDASVDQAFLSAAEVRSVGYLSTTPSPVDLGVVDVGQAVFQDVTLTNAGNTPIVVARLTISAVTGSANDFSVDIGGVLYSGASIPITYTINLPLATGQSSVARVWFAPSEHAFNEIKLKFAGSMPSHFLPVTGAAGFGGDPYLHPVIEVAEQAVDYDDDGSEVVQLDGKGSHTHEPGKMLTAWEWSEGGLPLASGETVELPFAIGPHTITLEIFDDNVPPNSLSLPADFTVVPVDAVPGVLALYHVPGAGQTAADLLDVPPATADFAETRAGFEVLEENGIGGSGMRSDTLVRLLGDVQVAGAGTYTFATLGGYDTRLYVDGGLYTAPLALTAGAHALEVRFAVDSTAELPLDLLADLSGGAPAAIDPALLTHDLRVVPPVINSLPSEGITLGGNQIVIDGFGFFTKDQVVVHWGNLDLLLADFTSWSAERIEFLSPPGSGVINVTVETPQGVSNLLTFEYKIDGPVPVVFNGGPTTGVPEAVAARWGPDNRLYVVARNGSLHAITFNPDYTVASSVAYPGVSALPNKEILGLAFDPFAPPGNPRLYVSHTTTYAQGGSSFTGPSPYPGAISLLAGPSYSTPVTVVSKLPTSNHDHGVNAMVFDDNGDLLVSIGSNTNAGVKYPNIGDLPESPLTAAILKVELSQPGFNGALSYVETLGGAVNNDQVFGEDVDLAPGTHVTVWASGVRNDFDLALTTWGSLYGSDNGPNTTFGVASTSMTTQTTTQASDTDELLLLEYGRYYGSPNRNRGRYDPLQAVYFGTGAAEVPGFTQTISKLPSSTNGIVEYRSSTFGNAMRGDLLALRFTQQISRIQLSADKRSVDSVTTLPNWVNGLNLLTGPGGALIAIDYYGGMVKTFLPQDVAATGLTVYDIQPWRAPAGGGQPFVIGGAGFGTLANTTVTIGGQAASLTSVTPTRIAGTLPASPSGGATGLVDVVVDVGAVSQPLVDAFRYMPASRGQAVGNWTSQPAMPIPLGEVACAAIGGKLLVVGEGSNKTLAYDFATESWSSNLAVRPFAGHHHASEVYQGKWYLIGSLGAGAGKLQIYDPVANSWSLGANLPWNGGSVASCRIGGKLYVSGGIVGSTTVDDCAVYDIALDSWTPLASMPAGKGRNHAASGTDGKRFWVFGGRGVGSGAGNVVANGFDDVQVYDPLTNTWQASYQGGSPLQPMPIGRGGMGRTVFHQGEFYVFGGETLNGAGAVAGNVYDRVEVYDPVENTWRQEALMPTARHGVSPVEWQGAIHLAGGGVIAGFSSSTAFESFRR